MRLERVVESVLAGIGAVLSLCAVVWLFALSAIVFVLFSPVLLAQFLGGAHVPPNFSRRS